MTNVSDCEIAIEDSNKYGLIFSNKEVEILARAWNGYDKEPEQLVLGCDVELII